MAITIKHAKTDNISDWTQTDLDAQIALGNFPPGTVLADIVLPSDWNNSHTLSGTVPVANGGTGATTLTGYVKGNGTSAFTATTTVPSTDITGLGTMSTQNANAVSITGGSISGTTVSGYIPTTEKGVALGVATLDGSGTVPISQLPASVLGALSYQGTWNASTNTPTLASSTGTKGYYYVVNVAGSTNLNGISDWQVGDWAVYNGSAWQKIDNTDAVTSVNGYTGTVVLTYTNVNAAPATSGTSIFYGNGSGGFSNVTVGSGLSFSTGTLSATGSMVYPSAGIPNSTGSAWGTSYSTTGTGTVVALQTAASLNNPTISNYADWGNGSATTLAAGRMWYNGSNGSWNLGMGGGNITQQVGEELFVYGKASAAITDSPLQIIYHTGTVGSSGVITFAPTIAGITDENAIIGVATENIALNGFGRVTAFGVIHGITTNGTAFGETWADDDVIWYNPVTGNPTKVKPSAPNIKFQIGTVINAGSSGSGSFQVALVQGTQLGGTDSNVKITSPTNGQILTYDTSNTYWKNTSLTAGTGISISAATGGVLTVSNSGVTSVTGTSPIASSGGATPAISISQATTSTNGYLSSTDWNTFNGKQPAGTYVTSVGATSPVTSSGGTTPTIAMPAATTSVSGYLTSTDWNTFNNKGSGTVTAVSVASANGFAGTSSGGATPALTLTTSITGVLKGNGTAISAATSGTDYSAGTSALTTGILKSTTTTGALSIAVAADFPTLNQNTTGSAATLTTARLIYGSSFNGSADIAGPITGTYGGTGVNNGSNTITIAGNTSFSGAFTQNFTATANTAVTLPAGATAASNNLLSSATAVGIVTGTPSASNYLRGDGIWSAVTASSATNLAGGALGSVPYQLLSGSTTFLAGNTTTTPQFLTSTGVAGVATAPTFTGSTGTGNVVLATSPTLVTPALGTPSSGTLTNCTGLLATGGGTGQSTYAVGDLLQGAATNTLSKLSSVATGNALISGGVTTASSWGKIGLTTHVSGILPVANGGTNASSAGITAFNNITGYTASGATGTTSTNLVFSASPTFTGTVVAPTINAGAATALTLQSAGTTAVTIDSSQNVGIGTTSPIGKLSVILASATSNGTPGTWDSTYAIFGAAGSATGSAVGIGYGTNGGNLIALTPGSAWQIMNYQANSHIFNNSGIEKMRIDSSGGLILAGSTAQKATGTTWSNPSDQRLKDNIRDYTKGTNELMQVRVREWEYNGKGGTTEGLKGLGVVADEVMTVLPDTVETYDAKLNADDEEDTEIKKFDATEITWLLVKTVQEQQTIINDLKARVETLEAK